MGGFLCGLVVAYKQVVPEHTINLFKRPFIRVKHLPSIILLVHLIFFLFGLIFTTFFIHVTGIFCASIYLRFYKAGDLGITGDRSETFSFASFFPDLFHPYIKPVSTFIYTHLVKFNMLPPLAPREVIEPLLNVTTVPASKGPKINLPVSDSDRRKAIALKELNDRLAKSESN
jgi:hypothetical protein